MASYSRAPSQPQRPTLLPHWDRQDRSGQRQLPTHMQLSLKSNMSIEGTYKDYARGSTYETLWLSNYYISISSLN